MRTVALISCSSKKRACPCTARLMYDPSALFRTSCEYAEQISEEQYILSAKYGLLRMDETIEPYDMYLDDFDKHEKNKWTEKVLHTLSEYCDIDSTMFVILAGKSYYAPLIHALRYYELPLEHVTQGKRINALRDMMNNQSKSSLCMDIHAFFNTLPRYDFDSIKKVGFTNGVYVMFEKGERFGDYDRIVRVGIHNKPDRLHKRLRQHFRNASLGSSVFRRKIADTICASQTEAKELSPKELEKAVTKHIHENISFTAIPVFHEEDRHRIEYGLIAALYQDPDFMPQEDWFGLNSPLPEVRESGLWLTEGRDAEPITRREFENIKSGAYADSNLLPSFPTKPVQTIKTKKVVSMGKADGFVSTSEIEKYILDVLDETAASGLASVEIVSGAIHKELGLKNRMPMVCGAMRKIKKYPFEIVASPPKGNGSTLRIKYSLI